MKWKFILLILTFFKSSTRLSALSVDVHVNVGNKGSEDIHKDSQSIDNESEGNKGIGSDSEEANPGFNETMICTRMDNGKCATPDTPKPCVWNADGDYPRHPPLILQKQASQSDYELVLPELDTKGNRMVEVPGYSLITIVCPRTKIVNQNEPEVLAVCTGGTKVLIKNFKEMPLCELGCKTKISETIHDPKKPLPCGEGINIGTFAEIGFEIPKGLHRTIRVCFDKKLQTTRYTENIVHGANIKAKFPNRNSPSFKKTNQGFFSVSIDAAYRNQILQLKDFLKSKNELDTDNYLQRGHMAPRADFVTEAEQDATFYYINALPQWQTINQGNWLRVEESIRELASWNSGSETVRDLTVYSGGLGVLNEAKGGIYLGVKKDKKKVVPVPKVTWKVVVEYREVKNAAVAIVVMNNPFIEEDIQQGELLCDEDICGELTWLKVPDLHEKEKGYTYCCDAKEFNNRNDIGIKDLENVELLKK